MSEKIYTISAYTENTPGVLHRITASFTKRKVNVDSLTVSETERKGISIFTIVVRLEENLIATVIKQLRRIIEVREVYAFEDHEILQSEIAFIKVVAEKPEDRSKIEEVALRHEAIVTHVSDEAVVIQATGASDHIDSVYRMLEPFGIKEFVRSGRIAVRKSATVGIAAQ